MPLDDLDGIANVAFSVVQEETIQWETAADWDAAASEDRVRHPSGAVLLDLGLDSYEDLGQGDPAPAAYSGADMHGSTDRAWDGSSSLRLTGPDGRLDFPTPISGDGSTWEFMYNEDAGQSGFALAPINSNGDVICWVGSNNPQVAVSDGCGNYSELANPQSADYGFWRRWTLTFDFSNDQFDVLWEDLEGGFSDETSTTLGFCSSSSECAGFIVDNTGPWGGSCDTTWLDQVQGVYTDGTLTTATKSFGSQKQPNLDPLTYTLNGGAITVDVIGSPGTGSEEVVSQTLDGASSYSLSWSNSHQDFRVNPQLSTSARNATPEISQVGLTG